MTSHAITERPMRSGEQVRAHKRDSLAVAFVWAYPEPGGSPRF